MIQEKIKKIEQKACSENDPKIKKLIELLI